MNDNTVNITLHQGPVVTFPHGLDFAGSDPDGNRYERLAGGYLVHGIDGLELFSDDGSMESVRSRYEAQDILDGISPDDEEIPVIDVW